MNDITIKLNQLIKELDDNNIINDKDISDKHHSIKELYDYRMYYNALLFNEYAKLDLYNVHKSKNHHDKTPCFGTKDKYFIVVAELPTGTITNHYAIKHWDLFKIPEYEYSITPYDNHTPEDCLKRMKNLIEQTE